MLIPWYYKLLGVIAFCAAFFTAGALWERSALTEFKGEVKGAANAQIAAVKVADTKNEGDYHASNEDLLSAVKSVHEYYARNPVERVRIINGRCAVSKTAGDPKGGNGSTSSADAKALQTVTVYDSEYNPEDVEIVAARLDALQKRLIAAGVEVR